MSKSDYCILTRNGSVACGGCDKEVVVPGLKPLNKKLLDSTMTGLEKSGRVKQCSGCDHLVVVCEGCMKEAVVVCPCCISEVDESVC